MKRVNEALAVMTVNGCLCITAIINADTSATYYTFLGVLTGFLGFAISFYCDGES